MESLMLNNELSLQLAKITQPFGVLTQMKLFIRGGVVTAVAVTCRLQLNRIDNGGEEV